MLFISNEQQWMDILEQLKHYIEENNSLPSSHSTDANIKKIGSWVCSQKRKFNLQIEIMQEPSIRTKWKELIHQYPQLFLSKEQKWMYHLDKLNEYIIKNDTLPPYKSNDPIIKQLRYWIDTNKKNYKKQTNIMKEPSIRNQWESIMNQYPKLFTKPIVKKSVKITQPNTTKIDNNNVKNQTAQRKSQYQLISSKQAALVILYPTKQPLQYYKN